MPTIEYAETAVQDLKQVPPRVADQITRKIARLQNGLHGDIKRLNNYDCDYRLRAGNHRILFDVTGQHITIQRILDRKEAYD